MKRSTPMKKPHQLRFKVATTSGEFEQIHRLNYRTFVEEIPQHHPNTEQRLVDKFHSENTYVICLDGRKLAGMLALRSARPFSLDHKLADLDAHLPTGRKLCEIRLLSIEKNYRHGSVFPGLLKLLAQHFVRLQLDMAVVSGTLLQGKLYRHLGFIPFGPQVGTTQAPFQPMYLTLERFYGTCDIFRCGKTAPQEQDVGCGSSAREDHRIPDLGSRSRVRIHREPPSARP